MKTEQQRVEAIRDTLNDIQDILAKSGHPMGEPQEDSHSEDQSSESKDSLAKMDPEEPAASEDFESPEAVAPEMEAEAGMDMDGDGEADSQAEMLEFLTQCSDEDLQMFMEAVQAELESRTAQEPAPEMAPEGEMAPPAEEPAPEMEAEKSYKEDYLKLHKSMNEKMESFQKVIEKQNAVIADLKKSKNKVVSRPAASQRVETLEKSDAPAKPMERLNKSETENFLMNQIRQRNPLVNRNVMIDLMHAKTDEELKAFQDDLAKQGLEFPKM